MNVPDQSEECSVRRKTACRFVALTLALSGVAGCNLNQLQFVNDHRLAFQSPAARHRVTTPLVVSWTMQGFDAVGLDGSHDSHRGVFAVFVDRAPMPVGKDLKWL